MQAIGTIEALEALYGISNDASAVKEVTRLSPSYRRYIEASPFLALATSGPEGLDCSPRGDRGSAVHIVDDRTLILPDRRGNNRVDSLRNIVRDPRVALLFLVPGSNTTMRVNGTAIVCAEPGECARHAIDAKPPRSLIVVTIEAVYFQCARALIRAALWDPATWHDPQALPSPGAMLAELSDGKVGGDAYDAEWPSRAAQTMW